MTVIENAAIQDTDNGDQHQVVDGGKTDARLLEKSPSGIVYTEETITPHEAGVMLRSIAVQRREDKRAIKSYASAMRKDAWILNSQTIILDEKGRVIDGFHRLAAIRDAETAIRTVMARNVPGDVVHTIDQHRKRRYSGVLEARGVPQAGTVARLMGRMIRIENGIFGRSKAQIAWSRLERVLEANPELIEAVTISDNYKNNLLRSGVLNILFFMALRADRMDDLHKFLRDFHPDVDEKNASFRSTYKFRNEMLSHRARARRLSKGSNTAGLGEDEEIGGAIQAFNDAFNGDLSRDTYLWSPDTSMMEVVDEARYEAAHEQAIKKAVAAEKRRLRKEGRKDEIDDIDPESLDVDFKPPMKDVPIPNLGLPIMDGYPGIREGRVTDLAESDDYEDRIGKELKEAHDHEGERPQLQLKTITVTPKLARELLRFNMHNRKIQPAHVKMMARDIKGGFWMVNAQPIAFTRNPFADDADASNTRLLNGQHRLMACIEANEPIEIPISWNVAEEAFSTFDTHAKRSKLADSSAGDERVLKAAAKFMWRVDSGLDILAQVTPSTTELSITLAKHPTLAEVFSDARRLKSLGSAGVLTYILARVKEERADYYDEFFDILKTGEGIEKGNPLGKMRTDIHGAYKDKAKRAEMLRLYLQAWESYRDWRIQKEKAQGQ